MTNASPTQNVANQLPAANGLAIVRLTIGAMCRNFARWIAITTSRKTRARF